MAKAVINLQKESGGIVKISPVDGIGITEITVPESGELATEEYVNSEVGVPNSPLVKTALNASGEAPIYACRAWVNFNGITVNIRESGNVSSITDNGVGKYTVNFTTAMIDQNYSVVGTTNESSVVSSTTLVEPAYGGCTVCLARGDNGTAAAYPLTTNSVKIATIRGSSSGTNGLYVDAVDVMISIFR